MNDADRSLTWQLDESGPEAYERYLVPLMFAPWAEHLIEEVDPRSGERALDVGCGTGIVARRAAARVGPGGQVVGLDLNASMLETARTAGAGLDPAIEWRQADASEMPFSDESFDVAFCQQVLQFVSDRGSVLNEIRRVLAPGGRLGLSVWRPIERNPSYVVLADALERHVGGKAAAMVRSIFSEWEADDVRALARDTGFEAVRLTVGIGSMRYPSPEEFVRREAASSPLAGPLASLNRDTREALVEDVVEGIATYRDDEGVVFPMETYLVVAWS